MKADQHTQVDIEKRDLVTLAVNQTSLYILSFWLVILAQRFGEYFFASLESLNPSLHFYGLTTSQYGWTAGSVITVYLFSSLLLAFIGFYLLQRWQILWIKGRISISFALWLSIHGLSRLLTGGISGLLTNSQLYFVFSYTGTPIIVSIFISILLYAVLLVLARKYALPTLLAAHDQRMIDNHAFRRLQIRYFLFIPWLAGSTLISIIYLIFRDFSEPINQLLVGFVLMTTHLHLRTDRPDYNVPIPAPFKITLHKPIVAISLLISALVVLLLN